MSLFDGLTNFFSGGKQQGYEDLQNMLGKGMGEMKGYVNQANDILNPYNQNGLSQYGTLQQAIARMQNPQQFMSDMLQGYTMSPMAQHQIAAGNDAAYNAAAASGMTGSTPYLMDVNEQSQQIANRDQQQYLNNAMGIYNQGLGMSQNLYNTGFGAAGQMSNNLSSLAQAVANMYGQMGQAQLGQDQAETGGLAGMLGAGLGVASKIPFGKMFKI